MEMIEIGFEKELELEMFTYKDTWHGRHGGAMVSTISLQQKGSDLDLAADWSLFCADFPVLFFCTLAFLPHPKDIRLNWLAILNWL